MPEPIADPWKDKLTPEQYRVLRSCGTEPAFSGHLLTEKRPGEYRCAACGAALFDANTKFDSGSGWPSFWEAVQPDRVKLIDDWSHDMHRVEVRCAQCDGHLGHLFDDGPRDKTGKRYCINSLSLEFAPR